MLLHEELTGQIISAFYSVYNILGYGFLERALLIELRKRGHECKSQSQIDVLYEGKSVGLYFADIVIEDLVIVEIKAAETLCEEHETQLVNYLKATEMEVGLLFNFGKKPQFKRKVFTNENKSI
jgi:GxxExxY protein